MSRIARFLLILLAAPALAQDPSGPTLWDYLKTHGKSHKNEANGFRNWLRKAAEFKLFEQCGNAGCIGMVTVHARQIKRKWGVTPDSAKLSAHVGTFFACCKLTSDRFF